MKNYEIEIGKKLYGFSYYQNGTGYVYLCGTAGEAERMAIDAWEGLSWRERPPYCNKYGNHHIWFQALSKTIRQADIDQLLRDGWELEDISEELLLETNPDEVIWSRNTDQPEKKVGYWEGDSDEEDEE